MNIVDWLHTFSVQSISGDEYCLVCPACFKPKLYFNVRKRIGFCHYDKCLLHHKAVTARVLSRYTSRVVTDLEVPQEEPQARPELKIALPPEARPLITMKDRELFTETPIASQAVADRGVSPSLQYHYNLHFDGARVYIPVYSKGEMVSYVGRAAWWFNNDIPRYKYPTHTKISNYFFDWDSVSKNECIILVENTFNAISYNNSTRQNVTTNFGSHLSDEQIQKVLNSSVGMVCLLWDGGSEHSAGKACSKLRDNGIECTYGVLPGKNQPDNYPIHEVEEMMVELIEQCMEGNIKHVF